MPRLTLVALAAFSFVQQALAQASLGLAPAQSPGTIEAGRRLTFVCAASDGAGANVYGTDIYTADSAVCAAAIHAGVLETKQAGAVSILIGSGARSFEASTRNGVTTRSYGAWPHSFTFVTDGQPGTIGWRTTWSQIPREFLSPVSLLCPPGGSLNGAVWGTDVYSRDSTICVAAVHAGVITAEQGGTVLVQQTPNAAQFAASERFGVKSSAWSSQPDAFTVTAEPSFRSLSIPTTTVVVERNSGQAAPAPIEEPVPLATSTGVVPTRIRPAIQNPASVSASMQGLNLVVSWAPVPGASRYVVAGASEALGREAAPPATSVTYEALPAGQYTFAVGAYFDSNESTSATEWPKATLTVVYTEEQNEIIEALLKAAEAYNQIQQAAGSNSSSR